MMLECKEIQFDWKIVTRLIYHLFRLDININEKTLVIGYDTDKLDTSKHCD